MTEKELPAYAKEIMDMYNISLEEMEQALKDIDKIDRDIVNNLLLECGGNPYFFAEQVAKHYPVMGKEWIRELDLSKRLYGMSELLDELYKSDCEEKRGLKND